MEESLSEIMNRVKKVMEESLDDFIWETPPEEVILFDDERGKAVLRGSDLFVLPKKSVDEIKFKLIITKTGINFSDLIP